MAWWFHASAVLAALSIIVGTVIYCEYTYPGEYWSPEEIEKYWRNLYPDDFAQLDAEAAAQAETETTTSPPAAVKSKGSGYPRLPAQQRTLGARVWKADELALHDGRDADRPLLIAILGEVYDVAPGARFYDPKGGYHGMAGKDASRAMATGDFSEEGAVPKLEGLEAEDIAGVVEWRSFYRKHEQYRFVGFLEGFYFSESGAPLPPWKAIEAIGDEQERNQKLMAAMKERFKACNSRTKQAEPDFEIWCDNSYHGSGTTPVYISAQVTATKAQDSWCACVSPSAQAAAIAEAEDMGKKPVKDAITFQLANYPECPPGEQRCRRPKGAKPPLQNEEL